MYGKSNNLEILQLGKQFVFLRDQGGKHAHLHSHVVDLQLREELGVLRRKRGPSMGAR